MDANADQISMKSGIDCKRKFILVWVGMEHAIISKLKLWQISV